MDLSTPSDVLRILVGHFAWNVKRGHGSFLTMEFGPPYLEIREPVQVGVDRSERVRRSLARRRVTPRGVWHFWIMHCSWALKTTGGHVDNEEIDREKVDNILDDLDGQRLVSVSDTSGMGVIELSYDIGGSLKIGPISGAENDEDQWSLYKDDGTVIVCNHAGAVTVECPPKSGRVFGQV